MKHLHAMLHNMVNVAPSGTARCFDGYQMAEGSSDTRQIIMQDEMIWDGPCGKSRLPVQGLNGLRIGLCHHGVASSTS